MTQLLLTKLLTVLVLTSLTIALAVGTGTGTGTGSHSHMRQSHTHTINKEGGERHRHHVPRRPTRNPNEYNDPKRPPPVIHNPKLLQDNKLVHDLDHMKEELPDYLTPEKIKSMSQRELDYHYFKIHDFDDNRKLDGLELMKALYHVHEDDDDDEVEEKYKNLSPEERKVLENLKKQKEEDDWNFFIELVDDVFEDNDSNKDGYLNYGEYINGRNRNYGQQEYIDNLY